MKICENGKIKELSGAEAQALTESASAAEMNYWQTVDINAAINEEIRKKYSVSEEFAVLRQKDEKPEEYAEYYEYCEECKRFVKAKKSQEEGA